MFRILLFFCPEIRCPSGNMTELHKSVDSIETLNYMEMIFPSSLRMLVHSINLMKTIQKRQKQ